MNQLRNRAHLMRTVMLVSIIVALAGCATTPSTHDGQLQPSRAQTAASSYRTFMPDGPGPHPAIAFLSGCSGFTPSVAPKAYERIAEQLRVQGYMVIFVDYLGRRGLTSCTGAPITHADAARDLVSAAAWLKSQPAVDPARIVAMGWSYGGGAVLVALAEYAGEQLAFSRAVTYYPDCRSVRPWKNPVPVLMLLAGEDDVAPGKRCQEAAQKSAVPAAVKIVVYPGAQHGFDVSELPAKMRYPLGTLGYHPQAAAAAWDEVQRFLSPSR
jgi:dienelactone hydrolase